MQSAGEKGYNNTPTSDQRVMAMPATVRSNPAAARTLREVAPLVWVGDGEGEDPEGEVAEGVGEFVVVAGVEPEPEASAPAVPWGNRLVSVVKSTPNSLQRAIANCSAA